MRWTDEGIVLAVRRHGENALLVQILTREHGRCAGLVHGGQRPRTRPIYQIGNRVVLVWNARLAEHLGTIRSELRRGYATQFLNDPVRLAGLAAAAALAMTILPEREPYQRIHDGLVMFLDALSEDRSWATTYVLWELALLADLGFGLDLTRCAATGVRENLVYVSPRSGQAISAVAGWQYRERLLPLPPFLQAGGDAASATPQEVVDGLALTSFFLERHVLHPLHRGMPLSRMRFVDAIRQIAISGSDTIKVSA